jgi:hypothetical protein
MPEVLYKFVSSPSSVEKIAAGNLKFATIPELNDPNEMLAEMNGSAVETSLRELRKSGFSEHQFQWLEHQAATLRRLAPDMQAIALPRNREEATKQLRSPFYDNLPEMERLHRRTVQIMQQGVGVLSLTSTCESLPMWAHYANNASGFVVEFRELEAVFCGDQTGSLNVLKPVAYYSEHIGMTFDPTTQDNLFFLKHLAWSYEQEWRVVVPLDECSQPIPGLHLKQVPASHIAGVILGWRCSEADKTAVIKAVAKVNPSASIKQASVLHGKLSLNDVNSNSRGK